MAEMESVRKQARETEQALRVHIEGLQVQIANLQSLADARQGSAESAQSAVQLVDRVTEPPPASQPAAAKLHSQASSQQRRQQQRAPQHQPMQPMAQPRGGQPGDRRWVIQNLDFVAGSSAQVALGSIKDFARPHAGMLDAFEGVHIVRVSTQSDGLAVVKLRDAAAEQQMRSAKATLPRNCKISIFRSLPPEQRAAARRLQSTQDGQSYFSDDDVRAVRESAAAALGFARSRLLNRQPGSRAPPPIPSRHSDVPASCPSTKPPTEPSVSAIPKPAPEPCVNCSPASSDCR